MAFLLTVELGVKLIIKGRVKLALPFMLLCLLYLSFAIAYFSYGRKNSVY